MEIRDEVEMIGISWKNRAKTIAAPDLQQGVAFQSFTPILLAAGERGRYQI